MSVGVKWAGWLLCFLLLGIVVGQQLKIEAQRREIRSLQEIRESDLVMMAASAKVCEQLTQLNEHYRAQLLRVSEWLGLASGSPPSGGMGGR